MMRYLQCITVSPDFFPPTYFRKHTSSFRRMSGELLKIDSQEYHTWAFTSPKIKNGCALVPPLAPQHILILSLDDREDIYTAGYRLVNYLRQMKVTLMDLPANTSLYLPYQNDL